MTERTKAIISAAVVLVANVAAVWGVSMDVDAVANGICAIVMLAATVYGIWKNHNFTLEAAKAQEYLDGLKRGE